MLSATHVCLCMVPSAPKNHLFDAQTCRSTPFFLIFGVFDVYMYDSNCFQPFKHQKKTRMCS